MIIAENPSILPGIRCPRDISIEPATSPIEISFDRRRFVGGIVERMVEKENPRTRGKVSLVPGTIITGLELSAASDVLCDRDLATEIPRRNSTGMFINIYLGLDRVHMFGRAVAPSPRSRGATFLRWAIESIGYLRKGKTWPDYSENRNYRVATGRSPPFFLPSGLRSIGVD